jgi:GNAT superfamily N-acetyltransferase
MNSPTLPHPAPVEASAALAPFTFPAYREFLQSERGPDGAVPFRLTMERENRPVGLLLAALDAPARMERRGEILSLFVEPASRRLGIGRALLNGFIEQARSLQLVRLLTGYTSGTPGTAIYERLLRSTGWDEPVAHRTSIKLDAERLIATNPVWYQRREEWPAGYRVVKWDRLTAEQHAALAADQEREHWIPEDLVPWSFASQGPFEPRTSLALLREDRVVGWTLTHLIGPELLRLTCGYVHPKLQLRCKFLYLAGQMLHEMPAAGYRQLIWTVGRWHPGMYRFTRHHLAPVAEYCRDMLRAELPLTANP